MKLKGYGYGVVGMTEQFEFYGKAVGAVEIPGSVPGIWRTRLGRDEG